MFDKYDNNVSLKPFKYDTFNVDTEINDTETLLQFSVETEIVDAHNVTILLFIKHVFVPYTKLVFSNHAYTLRMEAFDATVRFWVLVLTNDTVEQFISIILAFKRDAVPVQYKPDVDTLVYCA